MQLGILLKHETHQTNNGPQLAKSFSLILAHV